MKNTKRGNIIQNFVIFFAVIILLFGCDKKESKVENNLHLKVDPVLTKISVEAGVIYTSIHLRKDLNCVVVDTPAMNALESLGASNDNECKFFTEALNETLPVFEKIKHGKTLPDDLYAFTVFLHSFSSVGDDTYMSETIGLFSSLESCERIETFAREYDMPSKKCYKWRLLIKR